MAKTLIGAAVAAVLTVVLLTVLDLMALTERLAAALVMSCAVVAIAVIGRLVDRKPAAAGRDDGPDEGAPTGPVHNMRLHALRSQISEVRQEVGEHARRRAVPQYAPRLLADTDRLRAEVDALHAWWDQTQAAAPAEREVAAVYDAQLRLLREELNALHAEITGALPTADGRR